MGDRLTENLCAFFDSHWLKVMKCNESFRESLEMSSDITVTDDVASGCITLSRPWRISANNVRLPMKSSKNDITNIIVV